MSNDDLIYTWADRAQKASIYFDPNRYRYSKLTIYALITSEGDLLYQITESNFNKFAFQYFL